MTNSDTILIAHYLPRGIDDDEDTLYERRGRRFEKYLAHKAGGGLRYDLESAQRYLEARDDVAALSDMTAEGWGWPVGTTRASALKAIAKVRRLVFEGPSTVLYRARRNPHAPNPMGALKSLLDNLS